MPPDLRGIYRAVHAHRTPLTPLPTLLDVLSACGGRRQAHLVSEGRQASRPAASAGRHRDWVQSMTGRARGRLLWHSLVRRASSCHGCLSPAQGSMLDVPKRAHNCRPRCLGDAGVDDPVGVVDEIEAGGGGGAQPRCSGGIWKCLADATAGVIAARGGRAGQGRAGQGRSSWAGRHELAGFVSRKKLFQLLPALLGGTTVGPSDTHNQCTSRLQHLTALLTAHLLTAATQDCMSGGHSRRGISPR